MNVQKAVDKFHGIVRPGGKQEAERLMKIAVIHLTEVMRLERVNVLPAKVPSGGIAERFLVSPKNYLTVEIYFGNMACYIYGEEVLPAPGFYQLINPGELAPSFKQVWEERRVLTDSTVQGFIKDLDRVATALGA